MTTTTVANTAATNPAFTPTTSSSPTSATSSANTSASAGASGSTSGAANIAGNFDSFLQLLTTQLQNQDPLDPLDTNQFTQELVSFSSVEQQINMNTNLSTLISLQQTAQSTAALNFLGTTVTVNGNSALLGSGQPNPTWNYTLSKPSTVAINVSSSTGQLVYSTTQTLQAGNQTFTWNGTDSVGNAWPAGTYTVSIAATDASGKTTTVSLQVQGVVTGVDISQSPPTLTVNGASYTPSQIVQAVRSAN
jgi:flagellar basal-body rod modification protein FlgD